MISKTHPERDALDLPGKPGSTERRTATLAAPPWTLVLEAEPIVTRDEDGDDYVALGYPILAAGGTALAYVMTYPEEKEWLGKTLAAGALLAHAPDLQAEVEKAVPALRGVARDLTAALATSNRDFRERRVEEAVAVIFGIEQALRHVSLSFNPRAILEMAGEDPDEYPHVSAGAALPGAASADPGPSPAPPAEAAKGPSCEGGWPHWPGEVRMVPGVRLGRPIGSPAPAPRDARLCWACFQREMEWRAARNRELGDATAYALPTWESLPVVTP